MVIEAIRRFLDRHHIRPCAVLVACSGGADSTALLLAMADLRGEGFPIVCGHVNHHLRGAESDGDEEFVRELCAQLKVPFRSVDGSLDPEGIRASGIEGAARATRFALLESMRAATASDVIATAHQKSDQAETVLMRMLTGSGLAGLRAIHPVREDRVIRPLLDVSRAEIEAFLSERGIEPRVDRTNADPRFLRNRVRAALRDIDPASIDRIASVAGHAQSLWPVLERILDDVEKDGVTADEQKTTFRSWPQDPWLRQALLHRHIRRLDGDARDVSAEDLQRLAADPGSNRRVSVSRKLELVREGSTTVLQIRAEGPQAVAFEAEIRPDSSVFIPAIGATLVLKRARVRTPALQQGGGQMFCLPDGIDGSFIVRSRRPGDRFQPLGMVQDKKLKDFLIDRKIGAALRDRIPLLVWNGEIVWVAGVEVSERFKVTSAKGALFEVMLEHGPQISEADLQR
jgi:tRNA(Ile)-lysidine synthase